MSMSLFRALTAYRGKQMPSCMRFPKETLYFPNKWPYLQLKHWNVLHNLEYKKSLPGVRLQDWSTTEWYWGGVEEAGFEAVMVQFEDMYQARAQDDLAPATSSKLLGIVSDPTKKLKTSLVRAELKPSECSLPGSPKCGNGRYKTCPIVVTTAKFTGYSTGQQYQLWARANCKTANVSQCTKYSQQWNWTSSVL